MKFQSYRQSHSAQSIFLGEQCDNLIFTFERLYVHLLFSLPFFDFYPTSTGKETPSLGYFGAKVVRLFIFPLIIPSFFSTFAALNI